MSQVQHVGASGWTHDDWNGPFHPPGVTGAERLVHYALLFRELLEAG